MYNAINMTEVVPDNPVAADLSFEPVNTINNMQLDVQL